ncbi:aldose 1-epimerase family protein [Nocardioides ferulae]|uniref:aldose 1-epimerase family protein n=1 Tax=Nocardioides ferulae TaxID=2340821 RepID=UPI000EAD4EF2|nr:aldose 1-epimerase family protein [Nocardioides ferulae]
MLPPSGDQFEISADGYHAVVTESGAALRSLTYFERPLVDGFARAAMSPGGRGQWLVPWPNRVRDGAYSFRGHDLQLPLTEPSRGNASHGLVRWAAWSLVEAEEHRVRLGYRLMAQTGYPWTLDLEVTYRVSAHGLTAMLRATNRSDSAAPFAAGAHPYLAIGGGPVDHLELLLPASVRLVSDERKLPVRSRHVEGSSYDFRTPRAIGPLVLDDCFTELEHDNGGHATVELLAPGDEEEGVALWVDRHFRYLQVYTADDVERTARRSIAVEPMTSPPDAFRSGEDLVVLAPSGRAGDSINLSWGIRSLP